MELYKEFKLYESLWDRLVEDSSKIPIEQYFMDITATAEAIIDFIIKRLRVTLDTIEAPTRYDIARAYGKILQAETNAELQQLSIGGKYGYHAFMARAAELGLAKNLLDTLICDKTISVDKITDKLLKRVSVNDPNDQPIQDPKPTLAQYFTQITSSREAAIHFIKDVMPKYATVGLSPQRVYDRAVARNSVDAKVSKVINISEYNYAAFIKAISEHGLTLKDLRSLWADGEANTNAIDIFNEITTNIDTVNSFIQELSQHYADSKVSKSSYKLPFAYCKWFTKNTNATSANNFLVLKPEEVSWRNFVAVCNQKFNLSARDLNSIFKDLQSNKSEI